MMQENSKTLLRPTTLQQPTGPLRPCLRALLVSARPLLVSAPGMPDVRRFLSLSPVLLCQRTRLPSNIFYLGYGGLRMDRIMEVASVHMVCWTPWNLVRVHLGLANICLHLESTPESCLEAETGGGRTFSFPGMMQENSKTLLRPTPLQQPTGPLQPCLRALLVAARPLLVSARPLLVSSPSMPDVRRFLSFGPVLLCQGARLPSNIFYLDYGDLRMDRIVDVASEHKVC